MFQLIHWSSFVCCKFWGRRKYKLVRLSNMTWILVDITLDEHYHVLLVLKLVILTEKLFDHLSPLTLLLSQISFWLVVHVINELMLALIKITLFWIQHLTSLSVCFIYYHYYFQIVLVGKFIRDSHKACIAFSLLVPFLRQSLILKLLAKQESK